MVTSFVGQRSHYWKLLLVLELVRYYLMLKVSSNGFVDAFGVNVIIYVRKHVRLQLNIS